jgi:hypothetical protein
MTYAVYKDGDRISRPFHTQGDAWVVSWSGLFITARNSTEPGLKPEKGGFVPAPWSLIPSRLPAAPMMILTRRVEHAFDAVVQCRAGPSH